MELARQRRHYVPPPVPLLTQSELERRIEELGAEILGSAPRTFGDAGRRPRWISPADLVRRMRPFLVYN